MSSQKLFFYQTCSCKFNQVFLTGLENNGFTHSPELLGQPEILKLYYTGPQFIAQCAFQKPFFYQTCSCSLCTREKFKGHPGCSRRGRHHAEQRHGAVLRRRILHRGQLIFNRGVVLTSNPSSQPLFYEF